MRHWLKYLLKQKLALGLDFRASLTWKQDMSYKNIWKLHNIISICLTHEDR